MACNNQYIVQDCCDSSNSFRVGDICITGLTNGDIFYTECSGLTTGSTSFTFSGCVVVNSSSPILANAADTFSALTSYTACTDCQTAISGTPCPTPTPTVTPTTTNTSGLIYLTGQMSLPATLTVGMIVTDSSGNCWEIIATTGTTPNLTWGNQIFPVGGCASCLTVNPCPTLTPTVTPTNTPTNTVTPTVTPTSLGCLAYNIQVNTGISGCTFTYTDCSGATQTVTITSGMSNTVCALLPPTTSCGASAYTITNIGNCCQSYQIQVGSGVSGCTFSYVDCSGVTQNVTITSGNTNILCSLTVPTTSCGTSAYTMTNQGFCCQTYNINVNSNVTGCTFSYINCSGFNQTVTVLSGLPLSVCSIITPTTSCPASAYTMTMSGSCCSYYNLSVVDSSCTFNYIDCSGNSQSVVVTSTGSTNVCSLVTPTTSCNPTGYTITSASTCNPCVTYTLTNNNLSPYTFNYTDCSGVTQSITLSGTGGNGVICTISPPPVISGVTVVASGNCNPSTCYYVSVQAGATYECYIDYDDPISGFTTLVIPSATTVNVCSTSLPVVSAISAVCSPSDVVIIAGSACTYNVDSLGYSWDCPTVPCKCWDVYIDPPTICTYPYVDCDGNIAFETITGGTTGLTICSPYQPDLTSCGATYTATTSGDCAIAISGVYECVPCLGDLCSLGYNPITGTLQAYDISTNSGYLLTTSLFVDCVNHTPNFIYAAAGNTILEYSYNTCPLTFSSLTRTISVTGFTSTITGLSNDYFGPNFFALDSGANIIRKLILTGSTAEIVTGETPFDGLIPPSGTVFTNNIGFNGVGPIAITSGASGYYISQYSFGSPQSGYPVINILWTASTEPSAFLGDSIFSNYVIDTLGDVYQLSTALPYTQTFLQTPPYPFASSSLSGRLCSLGYYCEESSCSPLVWSAGTPYLYDFTANTVTDLTSIFVTGLTSAEGIARSDNYFFTSDFSTPGQLKIKQFDLTCLDTANPPFEYVLTGYTNSNNNLAARMDNNLIFVNSTGSTYQLINLNIDIVNGTANNFLITTLTTNQPNRVFDYDLVYTTVGQYLIINRDTNLPNDYYLTQIDALTYAINADVNLSAATTTIAPRAIFQEGSSLYIALENGDVYNVGLSSPYTLTFVQNMGITITNGGQIPSCITVLLV